MNDRWKFRPPGSNWGDFGPDDQLGRLNLLTPEKVMQGIAEVRLGKSFCLSLPLDFPGGQVLNERRQPPRLSPTFAHGCACYNLPVQKFYGEGTDIVSDDEVTLSLQYSTQWDSFAHIGGIFDVNGNGVPEKVYYNGFKADTHIVGPADGESERNVDAALRCGANALDIATFAYKGMQGRAVMLDLKHHLGDRRKFVGYEEIAEVIRLDRLEIAAGDMLVVRTGFSEALMAMNREPDLEVLNTIGCVLDGRDSKLLQWITDSNITAICADNYAVEGLPARPSTIASHSIVPLHEHCLFKLGIPLGELWWLAELADYLRTADRFRFLLTAPPLRLPGAVGSPVTPIATV